MIKLKSILAEIGDMSVPGYHWTTSTVPSNSTSDNTYKFKSKSGLTYEVLFSGRYGLYDVSFYTISDDGHESGTSQVTNMGEQYAIMSTVVDIIQDFRKEAPEHIEQLDILPDKSGYDYSGFDNNRRYKMYAAYIEKLRWSLGVKDVEYQADGLTIYFDDDHQFDSTGIKDK